MLVSNPKHKTVINTEDASNQLSEFEKEWNKLNISSPYDKETSSICELKTELDQLLEQLQNKFLVGDRTHTGK